MGSIKRPRKTYTRADFGAKDLKRIAALASYGLTDDMIAAAEGISESSLQNNAAKDLAKGRAKGTGRVAQTLFSMATRGDCPAATIFFMKCRAKWREADREDAPVNISKSPKGLAIG